MESKFVLNFSFLLFILLTLFGCERYAENSNFTVEYELILKNGSNYDVKITAFNKRKLLDEIYLKSNEEISKSVSYKPSSEISSNLQNIFSYDNIYKGARDSISIIFDNKKIITQSCPINTLYNNCKVDKYLESIKYFGLRTGVKRIKILDKKSIYGKYTITLTKEDYDRAIPIVK